jgi:hypothetical protein
MVVVVLVYRSRGLVVLPCCYYSFLLHVVMVREKLKYAPLWIEQRNLLLV